MFKGIATILLLVVSNTFMTLAWYGHIAFKSRLERFGLLAIVLLSWGIALFEYCFQVPANRIGSAEFGGPFSIWELKVIQEVVSLSVFTVFALVFMKSDTLRRIPMPDPGRLFHFPQIAPALRPSRRGSAAGPGESSPRATPTTLFSTGFRPSPGRSGI